MNIGSNNSKTTYRNNKQKLCY